MGVLLPPWARAALLVLASTLASSGCEDEAETTSEAPQESVSTAARDLPEVDRVALMERHYDAVITAHDAVIAGDHETAKAELTALAGQELPAEAPDSWRKAHEAMQAAAGRTDGIRDVDSAAAAVASTARACAQCHEQLGRVPLRDHKPPTPKPGEALQDKMKTHQWATERLWEGVAAPSEQAWQRGAAVLAETRAFSEDDGETSAELLEQQEALRALGATAMKSGAAKDRARLYGELLATCAGCHEQAGVVVPPAP